LCLLTDNKDKPNHNTTTYDHILCLLTDEEQGQAQPLYDHILCLLTDNNYNKPNHNMTTY
jgi:spermidine synthase